MKDYNTEYYNYYKKLLFDKINELRLDNGLFYASPSVDYNASWWRDNCFINWAYLNNYPDKYLQTVHKMLDVIAKMENKYKKLSSFISEPNNRAMYRFLHAKFDPINEDEINGLGDKWNHNQTDNAALILLNVIDGFKHGLNVIRTDYDRGIIQLLIDYLSCIFDKPNCSSWEEEDAIRLSSTALSLKVFNEIKKYGFYVNDYCIKKAEQMYNDLFPYEHKEKKNDLMLLYLPYFDITNNLETSTIVYNIEKTLLRENGVCRYLNDLYYQENGIDAPWTFGLSYLSIAYSKMGYNEIAKMYCDKVIDLCPDGNIPELWIGGVKPNVNTPLTWSLSMQIQAIDNIINYKNS